MINDISSSVMHVCVEWVPLYAMRTYSVVDTVQFAVSKLKRTKILSVLKTELYVLTRSEY